MGHRRALLKLPAHEMVVVALVMVVKPLLRLLYRFRAVLAPVWLCLLTAALGLTLHVWIPSWWPAPVSTALLAGAGIWLAGDRLSPHLRYVWLFLIPSALDHGRKGVLDRPLERGYLTLVLLGAGTWISLVTEYGWSTQAWRWLLAGMVVFGSPWWWHRRIRRRINPYVRRWPVIAERIRGFEKSTATVVSSSRAVTELRIKLAPTKTINDVGKAALEVASGFGLRGGAVTISTDPDNARTVAMRIVPRDPWAGKIPHPCPPIGSLNLLADEVTIPIGLLEDKSQQLLDLIAVTGLVGQRGSGKSTLIESWLMSLSAADPRLYALLGIDMANGATLGVWEDMFAEPIACDAPAAARLLNGLMDAGQWREQELARRKKADPHHGNNLPISPEFPLIFFIIDELPSLVALGGPAAVQALAMVLQRLRKVGVYGVLAGQNPTEHDFGSTELRAQIEQLIGLLLDARQSQTLWGPLAKSGWNSTTLAKFQHLLKSDRYPTPRRCKGFNVSSQVREQRLRELRAAGLRGMLDAPTSKALHGYDVVPTLPGGEPEILDTEVVPLELEIDRYKSDLTQLDNRVLDELPHYDQGAAVGASALAEQLAVSRDKVNRSLTRLAKAGKVVHVGREWARV